MLRDYVRSICSFNLNVRLFLAQIFVTGIYAGIYSVVFNLYVLNMGFRTDFLGLLISVTLIASSVASIPAGMLCDRFDRKQLLVVSGLFSTLSLLPVFLSSSPHVIIIASAVGGAFSQIGVVCATPFLTDNCERDSVVHVFSASSALTWAASVIGCAFGGALPGLWPLLRIPGDQYRLTLIASVLILGAGWALLLFLREDDCIRRHRPCRPAFNLRPSPAMLKFTAISVIMGAGSGMIVPYFNVYFARIVHASVLQTGVVFAVANVFMVAGFIFIPFLSSKVGRARSAVVTQAASLPFLLVMAIAGNFYLAATAYVLRMFLMNMAGPATTSLQMEVIEPGERGFAVGLISMGNSLAVAASTYASGLLMAGGNYTLPFTITCLAYAAAAALLYHYFGHGERAQEPACGARAPATS
jgi:MFS family permease